MLGHTTRGHAEQSSSSAFVPQGRAQHYCQQLFGLPLGAIENTRIPHFGVTNSRLIGDGFLVLYQQVWTLAWAPEIQTISVVADVPTSEVFNITTGSDAVQPEVQLVTVSYDDVDEVQTITTSQVCANGFVFETTCCALAHADFVGFRFLCRTAAQCCSCEDCTVPIVT